MKGKIRVKEKSLTATIIMIVVLTVLFVTAYFQISSIIRQRSLSRMEEGVNTVIEEITGKLSRDSKILNSAANILSTAESFDKETMKEAMTAFSPLMETMKMNILMPDNTVISANGNSIDGSNSISFEKEAPLGEHVSNRMTSLIDGNTLVLRHFVPIIKNKETVALLFGTTILSELPKVMNIDNI